MPQQYPGVAPLAQQGLAGFEAATWYGLYAPKGTPDGVVQTMYQAWQKALADASFTGKMVEQGIQMLPAADYAPTAFQAHTASEVQRWAGVVKQAGITLQ
jgi:tripartite-type tricarboxylate transporter receptor subunit TctC